MALVGLCFNFFLIGLVTIKTKGYGCVLQLWQRSVQILSVGCLMMWWT